MYMQQDLVQQPRRGGDLHKRGRDGGGGEIVDLGGYVGDRGGDGHVDYHEGEMKMDDKGYPGRTKYQPKYKRII